MAIPSVVVHKLARADSLSAELDSAIKAFFGTGPYDATRTIEDEGRSHVLRWVRFTRPPDQIGSIAGDAIHNLRTSLNHMVVALAKRGADNSGITLSPEELRRLQFPVVHDQSQWDKQLLRGRLHGLEARAIDVIWEHQPFNVTPRAPGMSHIATVADLDNADKHHDAIRIELAPSVVRVDWPVELQDTPLHNPYPPEDRVIGAELGRFTFEVPQTAEQVPIDFKWGFTMWIGYWNNFDVRYMIGTYSRVVRFVIDDLSRLNP